MIMNKKKSILLVEDEENLQEALKLNLEMEGYEITSAYDGAEALKAVQQEYFDLLILDIMLPEIDGITVCETVRLQLPDLPILILSAKNSSADRVLGLKKGADDYLTKPFNLEELLLRVNKLLEKSERLSTRQPIAQIYEFGKNKIDFKSLEGFNKNGEHFQLTKKEVMLLKLLIENSPSALNRAEILTQVWKGEEQSNNRTVDNAIVRLRQILKPCKGDYIRSVRGVGYQWIG